MAILDIRKREDGAVHVSIDGKIDENFHPEAVDPTHAGRIVLHLDKIRGLSSQGVRELENFVAGLAPREVRLVELSPAVATQVAMIPNLFGKATIESAQLPFACPSCLKEKTQTVPWTATAHIDSAPKCECGGKMEIDGLPEMYLPIG